MQPTKQKGHFFPENKRITPFKLYFCYLEGKSLSYPRRKTRYWMYWPLKAVIKTVIYVEVVVCVSKAIFQKLRIRFHRNVSNKCVNRTVRCVRFCFVSLTYRWWRNGHYICRKKRRTVTAVDMIRFSLNQSY